MHLQKYSHHETNKIPKLPNLFKTKWFKSIKYQFKYVMLSNNTEEDNNLLAINDNILNNDINDIPKKPSSRPQQSMKNIFFNINRVPSISDSENPFQQQKSNMPTYLSCQFLEKK